MFTPKRIIILIVLLLGLAHAVPFQSIAKSGATPLAVHEAEILIYLLPVSHKIREQGMEVGWELQSRPHREDFYTFWVVNNKRQNVEGSNTVGFYAVNKYTGDIWDEWGEELLVSQEIESVQRILRRAHGIDDAVISKHRRRP